MAKTQKVPTYARRSRATHGDSRPRSMCHFHHSRKVVGQPLISKRASGAPQFAQRSTNSQNASPTRGRTSAVQNPHRTAHKRIAGTGLTKTINATSRSNTPISVRSLAARRAFAPLAWLIHAIHCCLCWSANAPCPMNSPATAMRRIHPMSFVFTSG